MENLKFQPSLVSRKCSMLLRWLFSSQVRRATELRQQVNKLVNEQRDLLRPEALQAIQTASDALQHAIEFGEDSQSESARPENSNGRSRREEVHFSSPESQSLPVPAPAPESTGRDGQIRQRMEELAAVADQALQPCPHATTRENVKEFFVAATVILAVTTFFLQLTKIPTSSMQPTLFGITHFDLRERSAEVIPNRVVRFWDYWVHGISYFHEVARQDGVLHKIEAPRLVFPFVKRQRFYVGEIRYTLWFPPEELGERDGFVPGRFIRRGEDILRLKVVTGDHLLVDRLSFNFRRPARGEIVVFKTRGITRLAQQDQLYIKRLVALGGERVRLGDDHHLIIDGRRLDAATPHFENVYTFSSEPRPGDYFGHLNQEVASRHGYGHLAENFLTETNEFHVGLKRFLVLGDNTLASYDSRAWGDLPQENVIGKCWFVYWPFSPRFGWGHR